MQTICTAFANLSTCHDVKSPFRVSVLHKMACMLKSVAQCVTDKAQLHIATQSQTALQCSDHVYHTYSVLTFYLLIRPCSQASKVSQLQPVANLLQTSAYTWDKLTLSCGPMVGVKCHAN